VEISTSRLRADIYRVLDDVLDTGEAVEIDRRGRRLRITADDPPSRLDMHVVAWLYAGLVEQLSDTARELVERCDLIVSPTVELELTYLHEIGRTTIWSWATRLLRGRACSPGTCAYGTASTWRCG